MTTIPTPARWLPPEWAAQQSTLLTWPHDQGDWGNDLASVESTFTAMAEAITTQQHLVAVCRDPAHHRHVASLLKELEAVSLVIAPSNDIWARDHGPITVIVDRTAELLDFRFNGWGGKYRADLDDRITSTLVDAGQFPDTRHTRIETVLEGGSIETDGQGTLLVTSSSLLNPNRNGSVDRAWYEAQFEEWFGCDRTLWLEHGYLEGDDTDGHVDMLARFAPDECILYTACDDRTDTHYNALAAMAEELAAFRTRDGRRYTLCPLPWPPETRTGDGERLPLSYANFLIINGAVLVPVYGLSTDDAALRVIADAFPGRNIVPIPSMPLIRQHGSVHCSSMQIPFAGS